MQLNLNTHRRNDTCVILVDDAHLLSSVDWYEVGKYAVQSDADYRIRNEDEVQLGFRRVRLQLALNGELPHLVPVDARQQVRVVDEDNARVIPAVRVRRWRLRRLYIGSIEIRYNPYTLPAPGLHSLADMLCQYYSICFSRLSKYTEARRATGRGRGGVCDAW